MKQPDISNDAQQNQEESAADVKRAREEFDRARPRTGPNGSGGIHEDEGTTPKQKDSGVDTWSSVPPRKVEKMGANNNTRRDAVEDRTQLTPSNPK